MLKIKIQLVDSYDEENEKFVEEYFVLELEHSLAALSKWESKYEKRFLAPGEKSSEEILDYFECMIITPEYPPDLLEKLTQENLDEIHAYIDAKMTATTFIELKNSPKSTEQISSELVYFWMTSYQIPWEAQHWHLNRLFALIKVFSTKNTKEKKVSKSEAAAQRRALNEQRKKQYGTKG